MPLQTGITIPRKQRDILMRFFYGATLLQSAASRRVTTRLYRVAQKRRTWAIEGHEFDPCHAQPLANHSHINHGTLTDALALT